MNLRRGFSRGVGAACLLWAAFWTFEYFEARAEVASAQQGAVSWTQMKRDDPQAGDPNASTYIRTAADFYEARINEELAFRDTASERQNTAFESLWKGLVAIFLFAALAAWTYAGFNPRSGRSS